MAALDELKPPTELGQALLAALCYFDLFSYPLTVEELRRYRFGGPIATPSAAEVEAALAALPVERSGGFFFLPGHGGHVAERQRRYRLAEPKFRLARRFVRVLSLLPSVRLAAVCNSLAMSNAHEESDIDLFVVVRPGSIWTTRFLAAGFLDILGMRPDARTEADRICLSFLVTEEALDLSRLAIRPSDPYLHYWVATLVPLFDEGGVFETFIRANAWVGETLPGFVAPQSGHRRAVNMPISLPVGGLMRLFESLTRRIQLWLMPKAVRSQANLSSDVLVSDQILKFHTRDARQRISDDFRRNLNTYV
jgi:predicted nucleotidyltransferase